jgi:mannose-6-phosphate isomerase-like protein (cupin superfamily)
MAVRQSISETWECTREEPIFTGIRNGEAMMKKIEVVDLGQKFSLFSETWHPKIVGEVNESYVKLTKLKGEFVWHKHDNEDELFLVIQGRLVIKLRDQEVVVGPGQFVIIPRGVEHLPVAAEEVQVLLLEPKTTLNTGNVENERTVRPEWI